MNEKHYANYLTTIQEYCLDLACVPLWKAYGLQEGCVGIMLVGSCMTKKDWRDVDIRAIFEDEKFREMFPKGGDYDDPLWKLLCISISSYLSHVSGLPVDFQFQNMSEANRQWPSPEHPRSAIGTRHLRA